MDQDNSYDEDKVHQRPPGSVEIHMIDTTFAACPECEDDSLCTMELAAVDSDTLTIRQKIAHTWCVDCGDEPEYFFDLGDGADWN